MRKAQLCIVTFLVSGGVVGCHPPAYQSGDVLVPVPGCDTVSTMRTGPRPSLPNVGRLASDSAALVGTVADRQTGVALTGVVVRLRGLASRDVVSDSRGAFAISPVPPGRFSVAAMYIGYDGFRSVIELEPGRTDTLQVGLQYRACP